MPSNDFLTYSTETEKEPTDLPPPYSHQSPNQDEESTSSSTTYEPPNQYQEATSYNGPPDYDTISEQHGFLGNNNNTNNNDSFDRKGKAPMHPAGTTHTRDFGYDFNRGPIGNVLGLASNIVGYTTNRAFGATSLATGAATGIASHSARTASDSARAAMGLVENFMSAKMDQRDERMRARRLRKEGKCERKQRGDVKHEHSNEAACERQRGRESYDRKSNDYGCQQPDQAHQEYGGSSSSSSHQDSKKLHIKRSNEPFTLDQSWSGEACFLQTSNGHLSVRGSLKASDQISLETCNASITVEGQLMAKNSITVKTSNGVFSLHGSSISTKDLRVYTSNAPLQYDKLMEAKRIELKSKNAPILLSTVHVGSALYAETTNASIEIHIKDIKSDSAKIEIVSSNAPVQVHVPSTFSGYFSVKTSSGASASVVVATPARRENCKLKFETDEPDRKEGRCKQKIGNKSNIEIIIKTSNAPATLYI